MPNKASNAGHTPERSCVICRVKTKQSDMLRMVFIGEWIFDLKHTVAGRGYYICDNNDCLIKLDKWKKKRKRWITEKQRKRK